MQQLMDDGSRKRVRVTRLAAQGAHGPMAPEGSEVTEAGLEELAVRDVFRVKANVAGELEQTEGSHGERRRSVDVLEHALTEGRELRQPREMHGSEQGLLNHVAQPFHGELVRVSRRRGGQAQAGAARVRALRGNPVTGFDGTKGSPGECGGANAPGNSTGP